MFHKRGILGIIMAAFLLASVVLANHAYELPKEGYSPKEKSSSQGIVLAYKLFSHGSRETGFEVAEIGIAMKMVQRKDGKAEIRLAYQGNHKTKDGYYLAKLGFSCLHTEANDIPGASKQAIPIEIARPKEKKDGGFTDAAFVPIYIIAPGSGITSEVSLGVVEGKGKFEGKLRLGRCGRRPPGVFDGGNWDDTPERQQEITWSFVTSPGPGKDGQRVGRIELNLTDVEAGPSGLGNDETPVRRYDFRNTSGSGDQRPPGGFQPAFPSEDRIRIEI